MQKRRLDVEHDFMVKRMKLEDVQKSHVVDAMLSASLLPAPLISLLSLKSSLKNHVFNFRDWDPTPAFSKPGFEHPVWCSWSGVKGNLKTAQVTNLELLISAITISIQRSAWVSKLRFLRIFNGYSNDFERFLEQLNLGGSYFEGEIAAISGRFTRLMLLDLAGNVLEGTLPCQLGCLTQLERIEIGYNALQAPYYLYGRILARLCLVEAMAIGSVTIVRSDHIHENNMQSGDATRRNHSGEVVQRGVYDALLHEYMPNGNLDILLHGKNKGENLVADWVISEMEARVTNFRVAKLIQSDD
ncbi:hypothetical protein F3Y22_tig00116958pilonHSYRG00023 [Hibiscus syriacus]|uniref:Uncharacterized protein n=1 Tax=Hibiscus syriacus TaxID=106335 RepID=A0A6A2WX93_HIBSY|nr:hypothetical protein F3Y22_tig00116958pilonHSYRG00023 [Hibiscus syriacus]